MRRLLLLALCALLSANAGARTLYVDARRPNNNGNGLSKAKAKKTIQAAINVAKKGDTILVYPGTYAPIKSNNKKISIKGVKGRSKTILRPCATLGRSVNPWSADAAGKSTKLTGFSIDGRYDSSDFGVMGGTLVSCSIRRLGQRSGDGELTYVHAPAALKSSLSRCLVLQNRFATSDFGLLAQCALSRCTIRDNAGGGGLGAALANGCTLSNCLVANNTIGVEYSCTEPIFDGCTLVNCTVADNTLACAPSSSSVVSSGTTFANCILRNNRNLEVWWEYDEDTWKSTLCTGASTIHNVDPGNVYRNTDKTNRNPKFTSAYRLKKGSYCIDAGRFTKAQKKLVGTKDLAGRKRIKGKAIDRGCYEY